MRVNDSPLMTSFVVWSSVSEATSTGFTVTVQVAVRFVPSVVVAVMVASPTLRVVTTPSTTVATVSSDDFHTTVLLSASSGVAVTARVNDSPLMTSFVV